jgi:hypothetical protein
MKNLISLLLGLTISLLFIQSCNPPKCRNGEDGPTKDIDSTLLLYFGKYRPGNWWVYDNISKNKRDSVFMDVSDIHFSDYAAAIDVYANDCVYERNIAGKLSFSFLGESTNRFQGNLSISPNRLILEGTDTRLLIDSFKLINSFGSILSIDSFRLPSGETFNKVLKLINTNTVRNKAIFVAPDIGIIRFDNLTDTFYLTKSKIN